MGINIHAVASDHVVHMDHRIIDPHIPALLQGIVLAVTDGVGISSAHGQMAGCILIKQGVVEQDPAFCNGALLGNQRTFA